MALSALARALLLGSILCVGAAACSSSPGEPTASISRAATAPVPTTQGLLPSPTSIIVDEPSREPAASSEAELDTDALPSADETALLAQWQRNKIFEYDLRTVAALIDVMYEADGSLVSNEVLLTGFRTYAIADPALLARIDTVETQAADESLDNTSLALELVNGTLSDATDGQWSLDDAPRGAALQQLVTDDNERLDPLKPTFFRLLGASVALSAGLVNAPPGTAAAILVDELGSQAEAVYGSLLADSVEELRQAIPADAAFDSTESRRSFGFFARELVDRVARPALGE